MEEKNLAISDSASSTIQAFGSQANFEAAQRMAKALASSTMVPKEYQNNVPNCLVAMEMAGRIGSSVISAMQSLDIIHGRPSWRANFLIATVNASGRFTPIRFRFEGKEGTDEWGCRAVARDKSDNEECEGTLITIGLAKSEGWYSKNGSKWKTMPEQMLRYRAAAFWARIYSPELSLGMLTSDELREAPSRAVATIQRETPADLEAAILGDDRDVESGEVTKETEEKPFIDPDDWDADRVGN